MTENLDDESFTIDSCSVRCCPEYVAVDSLLRKPEYSKLIRKEATHGQSIYMSISREADIIDEIGPIDSPQLLLVFAVTYF